MLKLTVGCALAALLLAAAPEPLRQSFGPTPQGALIAAYAGSSPPVVVLRTNRAGRFAVVVARGGFARVLGKQVAPYLVERFSFGWQPVDVLLNECELRLRGISPADQRRLLAGVPKLASLSTVCNVKPDVGAASDVAAIRQQMSGPIVPSVVISGQYAFAQEYSDGGGCGIFQRSGSHWQLLGVCKGAPDPSVVKSIPVATQCALGLADRAACRSRR